MSIQIEHGIPMPEHQSKTHGFTDAIRSMAVGDSFVTDKKFRSSAWNCARSSGAKLSVRKISDTEIRVWRIA